MICQNKPTPAAGTSFTPQPWRWRPRRWRLGAPMQKARQERPHSLRSSRAGIERGRQSWQAESRVWRYPPRRDGIDVGPRIRPRDLRETAARAIDHANNGPVRLYGRAPYRRHPQRACFAPLQSDRLRPWRLFAILLDSAMGLAVQSTLPAGTGYATLEFKISFVRGMRKPERYAPRAACSTPAAESPRLKLGSPMKKRA